MIDLIKDLWDFMRERKKFWLAPIIIVMLLLGALIVLSQGSAVAPFIYTLFSRGNGDMPHYQLELRHVPISHRKQHGKSRIDHRRHRPGRR